jgi:hypothetical protein
MALIRFKMSAELALGDAPTGQPGSAERHGGLLEFVQVWMDHERPPLDPHHKPVGNGRVGHPEHRLGQCRETWTNRCLLESLNCR